MPGLMTVILREMFLIKLTLVEQEHTRKPTKDLTQALELSAKDLPKEQLLTTSLNKRQETMPGLMIATQREMFQLKPPHKVLEQEDLIQVLELSAKVSLKENQRVSLKRKMAPKMLGLIIVILIEMLPLKPPQEVLELEDLIQV